MITSNTSLLSAKMLMNRHGINQLPVILEHLEDQRGYPVGILDKECITLTCRSQHSLSSSRAVYSSDS